MVGAYLNHAGTSWPKPEPVLRAVADVWTRDPADWPDVFENQHQRVAEFFHIRDHSQLLLTPACTSALSIAVFDHYWNPGDRVLTSAYEHQALHRPLVKLTDQNVDVEVLPSLPHEPIILEALEDELKKGGVQMVAITAASNVTGQLLPIDEVVRLSRQYEAKVLIDAAQIAGWWDLDIPAMGADLVAFAGHKGPQAPWGIGGLFISPEVKMNSSAAVCEIVYDESGKVAAKQPSGPSWCDAGTVNRAALAGWAAAANWLTDSAQQDRLPRAQKLAQRLRAAVVNFPGVTVLGSGEVKDGMPTVAITIQGQPSSEVARKLAKQNVQVAGGLQCAPLAHKTMETAPEGAVRFSVGPSNTESQIDAAIEALEQCLRHNTSGS